MVVGMAGRIAPGRQSITSGRSSSVEYGYRRLDALGPIPLARPVALSQPLVHVLPFGTEYEESHASVVGHVLNDGRRLLRRVLPIA
jgi:hypothetical protein